MKVTQAGRFVLEVLGATIYDKAGERNLLSPVCKNRVSLHLVKYVESSFSLRLIYNSRLLQQICAYCSANDSLAPGS